MVLEPSAGRGSDDVVVTVAGRRQPAGRCVVAPACCAVGDTVPGAIQDVTRVQLVGPDGTIAQANLTGNGVAPAATPSTGTSGSYR